VTRLTFVVGKGGVGKTTVSCALALHLASGRSRRRVLLMSTDPAHSLGDMLEVKLGKRPARLRGTGNLTLWQVDSEREFQRFLAGNLEAILRIVESGTFFTKDEVRPLLDTTLPGMAEVAGLLALDQLLESGQYDHVVVDTAPFGHTLRLFQLPGHFRRFLNFLSVASSRDALLSERFGGRVTKPGEVFVQRWREILKRLDSAFNSGQAELLPVSSPESFSVNEMVRVLSTLKESLPGIQMHRIVLNRVITRASRCPACRSRQHMWRASRLRIRQEFPEVTVVNGPDPGNPLLGVALLSRFGAAVFAGKRASLRAPAPKEKREPKLSPQPWPLLEKALSFTVGKGGVGKTTTTAAMAVRARVTEKELPVVVCSTDPAPSLSDVFKVEVTDSGVSIGGDRKLLAVELDAAAGFRRWSARVQQKMDRELSMQTSGGIHVDLTFEKEIFAALLDIVPPGVDEIFAIFRILELAEAGGKRVLVDMAPTGHALELLRTPERIQLWCRLLLKSLAAHRTLALAQDAAVEVASVSQRVRRLVEVLRNPAETQVWVVMLAEPVPDRQTVRLLRTLQEIGLKAHGVFVNRVLPRAGGCGECTRARKWQMQTLKRFARQYGGRLHLLSEFPKEIAGVAALKQFAQQTWQIEQ